MATWIYPISSLIDGENAERWRGILTITLLQCKTATVKKRTSRLGCLLTYQTGVARACGLTKLDTM